MQSGRPVINYLSALGESTFGAATAGESTLGESTFGAATAGESTFGESLVAGLSEPPLLQATKDAATNNTKIAFFIFFEF